MVWLRGIMAHSAHFCPVLLDDRNVEPREAASREGPAHSVFLYSHVLVERLAFLNSGH